MMPELHHPALDAAATSSCCTACFCCQALQQHCGSYCCLKLLAGGKRRCAPQLLQAMQLLQSLHTLAAAHMSVLRCLVDVHDTAWLKGFQHGGVIQLIVHSSRGVAQHMRS
jgi:hypothetical protein